MRLRAGIINNNNIIIVVLAAAAAWLPARGAAEEKGDGPDGGSGADRGDGADGGGATARGAETYRRRCAPCHGARGEGVEDKHPEPLVGERSVAELARYIEKRMPEDAPGTCVGEEARDVALYIHGAFYSPIARARNRPARIDPSRLTVRQHRSAIADLVGSFRAPAARAGAETGLRAAYFNSFRPDRRSALERLDREVAFDFGRGTPVPEGLGADGFSARWEGSVTAPETGEHEFLIRTDHAARLWLNDSREPLIDAWVKSGDDTEFSGRVFLLEGRSYPLRLEFSSRRQGVQDKNKKEGEGAAKPVEARIELAWKPPKGVPGSVPSRFLSPEETPEVFVVSTPFPPDDRSLGYERGTAVSAEWTEAATEAAIEAAGHIAERLDELAGASPGEAPARERAAREFAAQLVERAFRRPLTADDRRLYVDGRFDGAPDLETAVRRVALLALSSPRFLYVEPASLAGETPDAWAVASRLSFALWDSLPDRELLDAAAAGKLASREAVLREASRMLADPRALAKLRRFLHHWLDIEHAPELAKDSGRFPGFDAALAADLRASLDLFLEDVLRSEGAADFRRLLRSSDIYLNGRLAEYYGFELPAGAPFQKATAGDARRAGVLSHPYLMARFAYTDVSSPIHRGVFLVRGVLGRPLIPPPEAFAPLAPELHPELTTRERVLLQTSPEACQPCHRKINPLGFALEHFDAAGRYRTEEKGKPVDASGAWELPSGETRTFQGVAELGEFLAQSEEVHQAFVEQLFEYLVKQPVLAYGGETDARLREGFAARSFDIRSLAAEIAATAALAATGAEGYNAPAARGGRVRRF
jgi:mono/diheme cytochrome c family protein